MKIGNSTIDFDGLLIDGPQGRQSMELKIMALLRVLVDNAGQVMTREDLIREVWGLEHGGDESLSRGISILRKALGDKRGEHKHIITISRVGYRFIADVSEISKSSGLDGAEPILVETLGVHDELPLAPLIKTQPSIAVSEAPVSSKLPRFPVKAFGLIMACVLVGFFVFSYSRPSETLSLQAKMEQGFSHIESFTRKGAISEAQDIFGGILSEDPSHAAARAGLAFSIFREYTHLERDPALLQRAKAHAEAALRKDEHLALANIAVAWAAEFEGEFERSHEYLDRADVLEANNMFSLEGRFRTFGKTGELGEASRVINTAIEAYPNQALFYSYRGDYHNRQGSLKESEADFKKAITLQPDSSRLYAQLAASLYSQNRTDEAIGVIQQGLAIDDSALLYNNLGTYLFFQGQYRLAASAFEKTLEQSGDTHEYLYWANLADAYRWSDGRADEAATSYRRALQLLQVYLDQNPKDPNLISRAALFNAKLGNLDEAQRYMDSLDLTSQSPAIQLYRSVVTHEILSNRSKALAHLEVAIKLNYPLLEILNDPELALLRQDPAYHKLLAKL